MHDTAATACPYRPAVAAPCAMAPLLLTLSDIDLDLGGTPLLESGSRGVMPGDRLCLVGRNVSPSAPLSAITMTPASRIGTARAT